MFTVILLLVTLLDYSWIKSQDIRRKRKLCLQKLQKVQRKKLLQLITSLKGRLLMSESVCSSIWLFVELDSRLKCVEIRL